MEKLTLETFRNKVYDYEKNKEWKFAGDKPCIVDFYADWCGPCKMLAPVLDETARKYSGKLDVYKVNTDEQQQLAELFGIQSIPTLLFVPLKGEPQLSAGLIPREALEGVIEGALGVRA